jgi:hypothetical protein
MPIISSVITILPRLLTDRECVWSVVLVRPIISSVITILPRRLTDRECGCSDKLTRLLLLPPSVGELLALITGEVCRLPRLPPGE